MQSSNILTPEHAAWNDFADALEEAYEHDWHCDHDYRRATQIMHDIGGIDIPGSIEFFKARGGYCDCEILFNVDTACRIFYVRT